MVVMKFGGTSVQDAASIRAVGDIVRNEPDSQRLVVVSACAGVTNELVAIAREANSPGRLGAVECVEGLRQRHRRIASELFAGEVLLTFQAQIDSELDELRDLVRSISILGELTDRSLDTIASFGERLSSLIVANHLHQIGQKAVSLDARNVMVTDNLHTRATPIMPAIRERVDRFLKPLLTSTVTVVTQGFVGATIDGVTTTIGRGGSDYSASILGAVLLAKEIQIWTDVDGILTCDPKLVQSARLIQKLSFQEASELAYFGARVLHPFTILPAVRENIPVRVLNTHNPRSQGTTIVRNTGGDGIPRIQAIACKRAITMMSIESTRMLMTPGYLAKVFEVFARHGKSVDVISTSEVSISLTLDSDEGLNRIKEEISAFAEVVLHPNQSTICIVGAGVRRMDGIASRIFGILERNGIEVSMVSLGASRVNITVVVKEEDIPSAIQNLHDEFFD